MTRRSIAALALLGPTLFLASCRSSRIDVTVENRSGSAIELLEVDYPSASFGTDRLADGADLRYPIQVRGSGTVRIQYTDSASHSQVQSFGAYLSERQSGRLRIVLGPGSAIQFHPELSSPR